MNIVQNNNLQIDFINLDYSDFFLLPNDPLKLTNRYFLVIYFLITYLKIR
jgi:hypothetical protein